MTLFKILFFGCVSFFLAFFAQKQTDRFTIWAITPAHSYSTLTCAPRLPEEAKMALAQPYRYLASGGQTFVFVSEDRQYVLKLLKQRLYRPSWWLNNLPLPLFLHHYKEKRNFKRLDKWNRDFFSYSQAYNILSEESGLVYCHLGKSDHLSMTLTIKDRIGIEHKLDLDKSDFLLQYRAETVAERIERQKDDKEAIKKTFDQILVVTNKCIAKGLYNRDPYIPHNCGFVGNRAIQIDVGRFIRKEDLNKEEEIERITSPFEKWLSRYFPDLAPIFTRETHL